MALEIVIVDDDDVFLFLHNLTVADSGLATSTHDYDSGKKALQYLEEHNKPDEYYLIFLDINMPIMNGWQFLDAIQSLPYADQVSVVIVTSSIDTSDREKAKLYDQVIDFVEKPLNISDCGRIMESAQIKKHIVI